MEFWLSWELFRLLNKKLLFSFAYIMPESIQISFGFVMQVCIYILLSADRKPCVDHFYHLFFCYGISILPFLSVDKHFTHELSEAVLQQLNSAYKLLPGFNIYF